MKKNVSSPAPKNGLSRGQTATALRCFLGASGLWGAWSQCVGMGTAVFTGFALWLGIDETRIPLFTTMGYLLAVLQMLSPILGRYIRNIKRLVLAGGVVEILFRSSLILIPYLLSSKYHLPALVILVALGLMPGYAISPFFNTWLANSIPKNIRARFTSQQTIVSTIISMAVGFTVGQFLDLFNASEKQIGFNYVFILGSVFGWLGYLTLARAPFPSSSELEEESPENFRVLLEPLLDRNFLRAVLFVGFWTFATGISGSLYSVFMINKLRLSYTEISIYNALFMITSIVGYRAWAVLVDRFGSKPVLQIVLMPAALLPLLWIFNQPGSGEHYLVPIVLMLSGVLYSGIGVAITPLQYGLLPEGKRRPYYLATWSTVVNLLGAMGPLLGSILAAYFRNVEFQVGIFPIGNLQILFAIGAGVSMIPIPILGFVIDRSSSITSKKLLSNLLQGNLLSYAYNSAVYNFASGEDVRARAALALGRSRSPLAIDQLVQALADASQDVRRAAARALGSTNSEVATRRLCQELIDGESDIRPEAAEALGHLGHSSSIDALLESLDDLDPRVRISAIRGLAAIGGPEACEILFWYFGDRFDPLTFPTLVDVLSTMGDYRVVKPALGRLNNFQSQAVKLQLLNSVCRSLGARAEFYRVLSLDDERRTPTVVRMLRRTLGRLRESTQLGEATRIELETAFNELIRAYDVQQLDSFRDAASRVTQLVRDRLVATGQRPFEVLSIFVVVLAINDFLALEGCGDLGSAQEIFLAVCLHQLSIMVGKLEVSQA